MAKNNNRNQEMSQYFFNVNWDESDDLLVTKNAGTLGIPALGNG
jgi:hypothetical protein